MQGDTIDIGLPTGVAWCLRRPDAPVKIRREETMLNRPASLHIAAGAVWDALQATSGS